MSENNEPKLLGGYEGKLSVTSASFKFSITMTDENSNVLGNLKENENGQLEFEGDATESAKILFEQVVKLNSMYIKKLENED